MKIILQYFSIRLFLTKLIAWCAELKGKWITFILIKIFIRIYKININEAKYTKISNYPTFNSFFMRSLRKNIRPINKNPKALVMPADGTLLRMGKIYNKQIFIIKRQSCKLETLLAGYSNIINFFKNGTFSIIYLSPKDYHRVHMPCNGILLEMIYVPGTLFSVNPINIINIHNIFMKNERVICLFKTNFGFMAQILIGAIIVGSIETIWAGTIIPPRTDKIKHWKYYESSDPSNQIFILKGQEMGRFKLGSTVINLFTNNVLLSNHLFPNYISRIGELLAYGTFKTKI